MSLTTYRARELFKGDGNAVRFNFSFKIWNTTDVRVMVGDGTGWEVDVTDTVDVTVTDGGGFVEFDEAPEDGIIIAVVRRMPFVQPDRYVNATRFDPHVIEERFDKDCAERQELKSTLDRALKMPETAEISGTELINNLFQAGKEAEQAQNQAQEYCEQAGMLADQAESMAGEAILARAGAQMYASQAETSAVNAMNAREFVSSQADEARAQASIAYAAAQSVVAGSRNPNDGYLFPLFDQPDAPSIRRIETDESGKIVETTDETGHLVREADEMKLFIQPDNADLRSAAVTRDGGIVLASDADGEKVQVCGKAVGGEDLKLFLQPDASGGLSSVVITQDGGIVLASDSLGQTVRLCGMDVSGFGGDGSASGSAGQTETAQAGNVLHPSCSLFHGAETNVLRIFIVYGQSLSTGSQGFPLITTREELDMQGVPQGRVLMLGNDVNLADERADNGNGGLDVRLGMASALDDSFSQAQATCLTDLLAKDDMKSATRLYTFEWKDRDGRMVTGRFGRYGQTPAETLGYAYGALTGWKERTLWMCPGRGATPYEGLKKGSSRYNSMLEGVRAGVRLAQAEGGRAEVAAVVMKHGEGDSGKSPQEYRGYLEEWIRDMNADICAITGQEQGFPLCMGMPSSMLELHFGSVEGMIDAVQANPDIHVLSVDYPNEYAKDLLHLSGIGYHRLGERMAVRLAEAVHGGSNVRTGFRMLSAVRTGKIVEVRYTVPVPPLVFDTSQVSEPYGTVCGFQYFTGDAVPATPLHDTVSDMSGRQAIRIVRASVLDGGDRENPARIRLELESEPTAGSAEVLAYAWQGHGRVAGGADMEADGGNGKRYPATIPRGNVRDSAGTWRRSSWDGGRLDNWAPHQVIRVGTEHVSGAQTRAERMDDLQRRIEALEALHGRA